MSKDPTPKLDQIRALRERNFEESQRGPALRQKVVKDLREKIAAVPARKPPSAKKKKRL